MLSPEIQSRIERVGAHLMTRVVEKDDPLPYPNLLDRMAVDHVPGVSIAVIHNGAQRQSRSLSVVFPIGDKMLRRGECSEVPEADIARLV